MPRVLVLMVVLASALPAAGAAEGRKVSLPQMSQVPLIRRPFWIVSGSAMAPLGGWGIVGVAQGQGRPKRWLVQGTMFESKFESYDVTNVQGLAIYPAGTILYRDRFAKMERKGTLALALAALEGHHAAFREHAQSAVPDSPLSTAPPEVLRTAIDSASGTLLVRYGFAPAAGTPASHLYHHVEVLVFDDLEAGKISKLHVFPVPLE